MTDPAGQLRITVAPERVTIVSTRPVRASRLFIGQEVTATARLLPALYSICATAQSAACAAACEQALGLVVDPETAARRRRLVAAETLREHLWRILLDWPHVTGQTPDATAMARVMAGHGALRGALSPGAEPFSIGALGSTADEPTAGAASRDLAEVLAHLVFGRPPLRWFGEVADLATLAVWAEVTDTVAARLVRQIMTAGQAELGRAPVGALPILNPADLDRHLGGAEQATADAFVARPTWEGQPRETSPLTRQLDTPLVRDLTGRFGNGLLTRIAAQLTEVAGTWAGTERTIKEQTTNAEELPANLSVGLGLAQVSAARGLLVHRVRIDGDRIAEYRILAPTEWNFHPSGVVAQGLAGIRASVAPADLGPLARLFITAVDPCVAYDLKLPDIDG